MSLHGLMYLIIKTGSHCAVDNRCTASSIPLFSRKIAIAAVNVRLKVSSKRLLSELLSKYLQLIGITQT